MNWRGNTWNRARDLERWLMSVDFEATQEWGRKKCRDFIIGYGCLPEDNNQRAERGNKPYRDTFYLMGVGSYDEILQV